MIVWMNCNQNDMSMKPKDSSKWIREIWLLATGYFPQRLRPMISSSTQLGEHPKFGFKHCVRFLIAVNPKWYWFAWSLFKVISYLSIFNIGLLKTYHKDPLISKYILHSSISIWPNFFLVLFTDFDNRYSPLI